MIPRLSDMMLPILEICKDGNQLHRSVLADKLVEYLGLTEEERHRPKSSGSEPLFTNRISWAVLYLKKANLVGGKRGHTVITDDGRRVLDQNPPKIDRKFLLGIPKYAEYLKSLEKNSPDTVPIDTEKSPDDLIISGYNTIRAGVERDLLDKIASNHHEFFESLALKLIEKIGYTGDSKMLYRSHGGGIDGILKEDKLGLREIYLQVKRCDDVTVPVDEVRSFADALDGTKLHKGIFITSSEFTPDGYDFVKNSDAKIILINGDKLVQYLYDYNLGVNVKDTYIIKQIDENYFSE